jgi:hypothetical protein
VFGQKWLEKLLLEIFPITKAHRVFFKYDRLLFADA